jgi:hypothetical protein
MWNSSNERISEFFTEDRDDVDDEHQSLRRDLCDECNREMHATMLVQGRDRLLCAGAVKALASTS